MKIALFKSKLVLLLLFISLAWSEAKAVDYATLPFSFDGGVNDIKNTTGLSQYDLGKDYTYSPKLRFDTEGDYVILKFNSTPGTLSFFIEGHGFINGSRFEIQISVNGVEYEKLAGYTSFIDDGETKTFLNIPADVRYIKWLYAKKVSGNVGLGNIRLTNTLPITLAAACTDGEKYYSTFSSGKAFTVPADLTVSEIKVVDEKLSLATYETGDVVPANTGVMVASATSGTHNVTVTTGGSSKLGEENMLKPSGDAGITASGMNAAGMQFYRLTMHNGTEIGYWWGAAEGAAFDLAANKAYLEVSEAVASRIAGFGFTGDNEASGVVEIQPDSQRQKANDRYDLQGRRVVNPGKGLYIINGKKFVSR